jgi:hypothetical protein
MIWGAAARRRARVDADVAAYTQWRSERDAVRAAYRVWSAAGAFGEPLAFETYRSALDREERAATMYASRMSRDGHLAETGLAHRWRACRRSWERGSAMTTTAVDRSLRLATGGASGPAHGVRSFGRRGPRGIAGWDARGAVRAGHQA